MANEAEVVKTDPASTTESTPASDNAVDAKVDESASSPDVFIPPADLADKSFEEFVNQDNSNKDFSQETKEGDKTEKVEEKVEAEAKTETVEKKEETSQDSEDKGPIPYERFKEVNETKNNLEFQLKEVEPMVTSYRQIHDYCHQNGLSADDFSFWMDVAAKVKHDPEQALKLLEPHIKELQSFKGDVLNPELQQAVADGHISMDYAKKLAAAENKVKFSQNQSKLTVEQTHQREQQRFVHEVQTSFHNWTKTKMQTDPDFKPKVNGAKNSIYEFVLNQMNAEYQNANLKGPQDVIAFADRVYNEVKAVFAPPQKNGSKVVKSTNSTSRGATEAPKSFEEAMVMAARKTGLTFNPHLVK